MILVTGATGFVGRHLVARLRARGETIRVLVRRDREARAGGAASIASVPGDVTDVASLRAAMDGVETVIHLVAIIVEKGPTTFERINVQGTRNVVAAATEAGVRRILHMSANAAADQPAFPYLRSKWQGERAVEESGIAYGILRPSLIFGDGDQFFNTLATVARRTPIVPVAGDGSSMFQPIWVEDVCTCFERLLDDEALLGRAYDVGGPEQLTYDELVDSVMRVLGRRKPKMHIPVAVMKPVATVLEHLLAHPPVTPGQLDLLAVPNVTALDVLPRQFGIDKPGILQEKLGYIKR